MGRPALGPGAKSVTASIRLTPAEAEKLTAIYGSPSKALRSLVASVVTREVAARPVDPTTGRSAT